MSSVYYVDASYNGSGSSSTPWPAGHNAGDIGILLVKSTSAPAASGWTLISRIGNLSAFWRRALSSSEPNASLTGGGTYDISQIVVYAGCSPTGTPVYGVRTRTPMNSNANSLTGSFYFPQGMVIAATASGLTYSPSDPTAPGIVAFTERSNPAATLEFWDGDSSTIPTTLGDISFQYGNPSASFSGMSFVLVPSSDVSSSFSSAGAATVSNPGNINRPSSFSSAGAATVSNPGAYKAASAFASAGAATVSNPGSSLFRSSFSSAGTSTAVMAANGNAASSFSSINSSSANMVGVSTAESGFSGQGSSLAVMFSPHIASSSFASAGSSTAQMFAPSLQVTTLVDGSGGDPDGGATIDWTLCDFADIDLIAGTGSFPIDHVNLIAGKKISVHVHNDSGASGTILWDGGDAPVNWIGLPAPPAMPANGETLHVEFECNDDRTEIFGRLFVDEYVRETLAGLDRRYSHSLFDHSTNSANVGTGETTLYSDTIIGGTLASNGDKILAEYAVELSMSVNAKQIKLYFPTTVVIFDTGSLAITATTDCHLRLVFVRKSASTARAVVTINTLPVAVGGGNSQITDEASLVGINFDLDQVIRLAAVGGASGDVIAKLGCGEFKPAAV